jgi:hypothetical protein
MPLARRLLISLLACALLIAGCGGSDTEATKFIAKSRAAKLQTTLDAVEEDVAADRCNQAASGVERMRAQVADFPAAYDAGLVANVAQWVDHIDARLESDCGATEEESPTPSPSPSPEPSPTETAEPDETATPDDTPEPTETASPDPEPTPEPDEPDPVPTPPASDDLDGTGGAPGEEGE